ncbi:hypothetical protein Aperf_G00000117317 [Anoplocephala perfoliata]
MEYDCSTRRKSVIPSGKTIRRHTYDGSESPSSPFSTVSSSPPPHSPLPKSSEGSDIFSTKIGQLSSILGLRRKETLRTEYFEKWRRHAQLLNEFRKIVKVIVHLDQAYENSKSTLLPTRFSQLKSCVHRAHMFLLVCGVHSSFGKDTALCYASDRHGSESDLSFQRSLQHGSVICSEAKEAEGYRHQEEAFESND